jgi:hypothetical protein
VAEFRSSIGRFADSATIASASRPPVAHGAAQAA